MHNLTTQQAEALKQFDRFIASPARYFIVKGYAGTGKTFLIGQMAQRLAMDHIPAMLLAPTGRAARVLSYKTGFPASTIHKAIYNLADLIEGNDKVGGFKFYFRLKDISTDNLSVVAFVDEASMLSDNYSEGEFLRFGSGRLLADLLQFLRIDNPAQKSKLVVVGDPAQLPPVNMPISPALDSSYLEEQYGLQVNQVELTEVVRQTSDSPILQEATKIRKTLDSRIYNQLYVEQMPPHITEIKMEDLPNRFVSANKNTTLPCVICLAYSNATCFNVNIAIRSKLFGGNGTQQPIKSDILLVIRNNAKTGLLNGDQIYVLEAAKQAQVVDVPVGAKHIKLTFRNVSILKEADDGSTMEFETKLIENVLYSEKRDLSPDELKALFIYFKIRHPRLRPNTKEFTEVLRDDTYFNALQVKYGYAMTCHKAQGGEWDEVFVIFENHRTDALALRWAYTALTRARTRITGINLPRMKPWSAIPLGGTCKVDPPPLPLIKKNRIGVESEMDPKPTCWDSQFPSEPTFIKFLHQRIAFSLTQSGIAIDDVIVRATNYFWRYSVSKSMKRANVQVYFNSKGAVRPQILPNTASDTEFAENVINIITGAANTPYPSEEIKIDFPDNRPHLREFFENYIEPRVSMNSCHVTKVEHLQFRERYYISSSDWDNPENFEVKIFGTPLEVENAIKKKVAEGYTGRMTAGFCWDWSNPKHDGTLAEDVIIGDYKRPWNANPNAGRLASGIPPSNLWAYNPNGINQVGCIYTAQGFEFDYVGVIFGKDLRYDFNSGRWIGDKIKSFDSVVKKAEDKFVDLVKNTYRVLMTRGMKGCYLYFMDKDTENFFRSRMG